MCDRIAAVALTPRQDCFFYSLVYDPQQKTLLADKGEIRVGSKYQADVADSPGEGQSRRPVHQILNKIKW